MVRFKVMNKYSQAQLNPTAYAHVENYVPPPAQFADKPPTPPAKPPRGVPRKKKETPKKKIKFVKKKKSPAKKPEAKRKIKFKVKPKPKSELEKRTGLNKEKANELEVLALMGMLPPELRKKILTPSETGVTVGLKTKEQFLEHYQDNYFSEYSSGSLYDDHYTSFRDDYPVYAADEDEMEQLSEYATREVDEQLYSHYLTGKPMDEFRLNYLYDDPEIALEAKDARTKTVKPLPDDELEKVIFDGQTMAEFAEDENTDSGTGYSENSFFALAMPYQYPNKKLESYKRDFILDDFKEYQEDDGRDGNLMDIAFLIKKYGADYSYRFDQVLDAIRETDIDYFYYFRDYYSDPDFKH